MEVSQYLEYDRHYIGPIRLVILDWAGLTVDYGCYAPAVVFIEVFKRSGIDISMEQARAPMGMFKRDHIKSIFEWNSDVVTNGRKHTDEIGMTKMWVTCMRTCSNRCNWR